MPGQPPDDDQSAADQPPDDGRQAANQPPGSESGGGEQPVGGQPAGEQSPRGQPQGGQPPGDQPPDGQPPGSPPPDGDGTGGAGGLAPDDDDSGGSRLRRWGKRVGLALGVLVGLVVLLYLLGIIGPPSAGVADVGDWGTVSGNRTEVVTTMWIRNPNPLGVSLGDSVTADYDLSMNDVHLAQGSKTGISIPKGNSTTEVHTQLRNDRLNDWWANFVNANETIDLAIDAEIRVQAFLSGNYGLTIDRTILNESTPVIDALSGSVNQTSGTYTRSVDTTSIDDSVTGSLGGAGGDGSVTVGYEVRRGWATWAGANASTTAIRFHMLVHNPGDVPVPAVPDGLGFFTLANNVTMFEGDTGDLAAGSVNRGATIAPGETREVTFAVVMDNDNIDEWFTSHVRRGERTRLETQFQLVFESPATGETFRLPRDSAATHDCQFVTQILVDEQPAESTCGQTPGPQTPGPDGAGTGAAGA